MKIFIINHDYHYEIENITRLFFQNEKLVVEREFEPEDEAYIYTEIRTDNDRTEALVDVFVDGTHRTNSVFVNSDSDDVELEISILLYDIFTQITGITPPWGVLTGVRPIKLFRRYAEKFGFDYAVDRYKNKLKVSQEKILLTIETEKNESEILRLSKSNSYSLYISIPFCPSRCSYCSFVSSAVAKNTAPLVEPYVELLCKELEATAEYAGRLGLNLESVYMGGGTPTTLNAQQMRRVLSTVNNCFDISNCREFTVEAGRPDTITEEKLEAIISCSVDRISINPQTLNDGVLETIGRRHTAQQAIDAFHLARQYGFNHINMDLISGLPNDSYQSFVSTLDRVIELDPESITVHTLSMKRASNLTMDGKQLLREEANRTANMLTYANKALHMAEYFPYYLYRQSKMVGNLENTGWSKKGREGIYNVYIMDETHTILACGAGAVSKLKSDKEDYLERIFNYKYPYEYISRFDEILKRKERIESFYAEHY